MPRTTRAVAQRLGTKQKSRRRSPRQAPETPASVERILDEVAPTGDASAGGVLPTPPPAVRSAPGSLPRRTTMGTARGVGRAAPTRRRYADYASEYAYVWGDLRRIGLVAGALLLLLIVLSFFIG
jgi:hypothetical protein